MGYSYRKASDFTVHNGEIISNRKMQQIIDQELRERNQDEGEYANEDWDDMPLPPMVPLQRLSTIGLYYLVYVVDENMTPPTQEEINMFGKLPVIDIKNLHKGVCQNHLMKFSDVFRELSETIPGDDIDHLLVAD